MEVRSAHTKLSQPKQHDPLPAIHTARSTKQHPLGPLIEYRQGKNPLAVRGKALVVAAAGLALFAVAAILKPDPSGLGTHRQLGLLPCSSVILWGYPCPTCGMTTAFAHAVCGQWVQAFQAHPGGLVLAGCTAVMIVLAINTLITARVWWINWYRVSPTKVVLVVILVILGGWGYKLAAGVIAGTLPVH